MKPVSDLDGIIDAIVGTPLGGILDHADTVIDDFHAVGGKISNHTHEGLIYDSGADRRSAQILFDKQNRVLVVGLDGARREGRKVALCNLGRRVENEFAFARPGNGRDATPSSGRRRMERLAREAVVTRARGSGRTRRRV
jgi:hypothetical protein